jgi:hypothetical protein
MKLAILAALAFVAAAVPAAAQAPAPTPTAAQPPQQPAPQAGSGLNLKLDDAAGYTRETPREGGGSAEALPSVGGNARPLPASSTSTATQPFPKDTERGER